MTIFGVDLHPRYQAGISLRRIRDEGFRFAILKMSEATNTASYAGSRGWAAEARSLGMHVGGYHYLRAGNIAAQVDAFCRALEAAGSPAAMLDVEEGSGNIVGVWDFVNRAAARGHPIRMLYLPRWYWQQIGQPSLAGLPPLWSSRYPNMTPALATAIYARVPGSYWGGYGGGNVAVLQFTSTARVAGYTIDANAFEGNEEQLAALFGAAVAAPPPPPPAPTITPHSEDATMHEYTPEPAAGAAKKDWPRRTITFGFDDEKVESLRVHFGSRGGWIHSARWWVRDPNWNPNIPKHFPKDHPVGPEGSERFIGYAWIAVCPVPGADELELTFSAPDGMHIFPAYK